MKKGLKRHLISPINLPTLLSITRPFHQWFLWEMFGSHLLTSISADIRIWPLWEPSAVDFVPCKREPGPAPISLNPPPSPVKSILPSVNNEALQRCLHARWSHNVMYLCHRTHPSNSSPGVYSHRQSRTAQTGTWRKNSLIFTITTCCSYMFFYY